MLFYDDLNKTHREQVAALFNTIGRPRRFIRRFIYELGTNAQILSRKPYTTEIVVPDGEYVLFNRQSGEYMTNGRESDGVIVFSSDTTKEYEQATRLSGPALINSLESWVYLWDALRVGNWHDNRVIAEATRRHAHQLDQRSAAVVGRRSQLIPCTTTMLEEMARDLSLSVGLSESSEALREAILFKEIGYVELPDAAAVATLFAGSSVEDTIECMSFGDAQEAVEIVLRRFAPSTPLVAAWEYLPDFVKYAILEYDRAFKEAHLVD